MTIELDLLSKSEFRVEDIDLVDVDLRSLASTVAKELGFSERELLVTDYSNRILTFDVLRRSVFPHALLGKQADVLAALARQPGVRLGPAPAVAADGVLGWIADDTSIDANTLAQASRAAQRALELIGRRACVISTGAELVDGAVRDTNGPLIERRLAARGFHVELRGPVRDDLWSLVAALNCAADDGFGLLVTTGGVGAEAKDLTVEALLEIDPEASTPYVCTFDDTHRRHVKPGVRVAVGRVRGALAVCLPGPTDEVGSALDVALPLLAGDAVEDGALAESIARRLRQQWRDARKHQPGGE